jgi:hypothetical protein
MSRVEQKDYSSNNDGSERVKFDIAPRRLAHLLNFIRAYLVIRRSSLFDSGHYLGQIRRLRFKHSIPLAHYLWSGERKGLEPFPGFKPWRYALLDESLVRSGDSPLLHYILHRERAPSRSIPTRASIEASLAALEHTAPRALRSQNRSAIVCHVFYYYMWDELESVLSKIQGGYDLIVTATERPAYNRLCERIKGFKSDAYVLPFPNHGRDLFPFYWLAERGTFTPYDQVCKIHTKKSVHRPDGDGWRRTLIGGLLGREALPRIEERFARDSLLGMLAVKGTLLKFRHWDEANSLNAERLLGRIGEKLPRPPPSFPAGSMYWFRPKALSRLLSLKLGSGDFELEDAQVDGTTAHALERIVGICVRSAGFTVAQIE